jgi:uncharacterized protein (DUF4415 family)
MKKLYESSRPARQRRANAASTKKLSEKQRQRELARIAAIPDDEIDTSDIPELTEEQMRRAVRGRFYRPLKKPVTIRLDADVLDWLKSQGPGYQTKANRLLRAEMLRALAPRRRRK